MISIGRGHYPENHTSNDMPEIVSYSNITQSIEITLKILETLEEPYLGNLSYETRQHIQDR